jgi:Ca-activated chloride channel family protein
MNPLAHPTLLAFAFRFPIRLWLLIAVLALGVAYGAAQFRSRSYAVKFTNLALLDSVAPNRPGWRRHLPAALMLVALSGMVAAFAQPNKPVKVPRERATIIIAIDTSLSMKATDVTPSRIRAAQVAAKAFIKLLPPRLNVGFVTFNGVAQVRVPPTQDREPLLKAVDDLRLGERTAIGEAIFASLDAIKVATPKDGEKIPARIVLMSDGSTTSGRPDAQASAAAKKAGVPVSTIAFGTPGGTIVIAGESAPVSVAVNPDALAKIANDTKGTAFTAATGAELKKVYEDIGSKIGYTTEDKDITTTFVGASLLVLFAAAILSQLWFSRLP